MSERQRTIDRQLQQQRDRERHIIRKQRSRHAAQVRAQDGCSTMITIALLAGGLTMIAFAKKIAR